MNKMPERAARKTPHSRMLVALALIAFGVPGILSLLLVLPSIDDVPRGLLLVNPAIMLVVFAFAGAWAAPSAGLRSRIGNRIAGGRNALFGPAVPAVFGIGIAAGFAIALADHASRGAWQLSAAVPPSLPQSWAPASLPMGVLYGGIVEEITMRWGLMSVIVLAVWKLGARKRSAPPGWAVWTGIALAALIFAAGHLPALATLGEPLEPPLIIRTLLWNGALGVLFGTVFARHDLESAIACHAGFHVGLVPAFFASTKLM